MNTLSSPLVRAANLTIGYRRRKEPINVQEGLNLDVYSGELVCLIGPNGCGKSTLLKTLSGLIPPLSGDIWVDGVRIKQQQPTGRARFISLVLTDRVEVTNLTVYELVAMGRNPYTDWLGNLTEEDHKIVNQALTMVHLESYGNRFVNQLSDGERQRAMIAKALVQQTPVIFLDEPTSHLDLPNRVEVMMLLRQLAADTGKAIVLSIHELDLAMQTSDKLWLMVPENGVIVGTPAELLANNSIQSVFANRSFHFDEWGRFVINERNSL